MAAKEKRLSTLEKWAIIISLAGTIRGIVALAIRTYLVGWKSPLDLHIVEVTTHSTDVDHHIVQVVKDSLNLKSKRRP